MCSTATFTDKTGKTGRVGDEIIVLTYGRNSPLPQLATAVVTEIIAKTVNSLALGDQIRARITDVRLRINGATHCTREAAEVIVMPAAACPSVSAAKPAPSVQSVLRRPINTFPVGS